MAIRNLIAWLFFANLAVTLQPLPAEASLPVPYAIVGCIKEGKFQSEGKRVGSTLISPATRALAGKTVRVEGFLSPGDRFQATAVFIVDQRCRKDLQRSYFLCHPCATRLHSPPSKMISRREHGTEVRLAQEAIKEFDWPLKTPGRPFIQGVD